MEYVSNKTNETPKFGCSLRYINPLKPGGFVTPGLTFNNAGNIRVT